MINSNSLSSHNLKNTTMKNFTTTTLAVFFMLSTTATAQTATTIKAVDEEVITHERAMFSLKFDNPDTSKKVFWILKLLTEFSPLTGGSLAAVDGAIIDATGLQPGTSYELRVSMDTFQTYVSLAVSTTAAPLAVEGLTQKPFTAYATGTAFVIKSEKATDFKIYNLLGLQVITGSVDAGEVKTVDAASLPKGYYFANNGNSGTVRLLLQ
jgi:hypothetical protein